MDVYPVLSGAPLCPTGQLLLSSTFFTSSPACGQPDLDFIANLYLLVFPSELVESFRAIETAKRLCYAVRGFPFLAVREHMNAASHCCQARQAPCTQT